MIHMNGRTMGGVSDYPSEDAVTEADYEPLKPQNSYTTEMGNTMAATLGRERVVALKNTKKAPEGRTASEGVGQSENVRKTIKPYKFPPINLLTKGSGKPGGDSGKELRETAARLQQTLQTFCVKVTVTDISQ